MNKIITILAVVIIILIGGYFLLSNTASAPSEKTVNEKNNTATEKNIVSVTPISHATFVLNWGDTVIYNDPVGGGELFESFEKPDIVLVSDIHGDHLNAETLESVLAHNTILIAPQAVIDELPENLAARATLLSNNEATIIGNISITALPMYNLPDQGVEIRHEKGRGNGYLLEENGYRVYIAGDTADIPEMRSLPDIDMAFVPMNLPFTMDVERAADAVIEFAPKIVYPYHYRGQDGLSDIEHFKELVDSANLDIEVALLDWYK